MHRAVWMAGAAAAIVLLAGALMWLRPRPGPPEVDLAGAGAPLVEAVTEARQAVLREPRRADAWGHLGMLLYQHRFPAEARACLAEAERLNPFDARWPYVSAQIDRIDDAPRAIAALERALAGDADNPIVRLQLADLLYEQGRLDDAELQFQGVLESPRRQAPFDEARATLGLARLALDRGRLDDALTLAQRSEHAVPTMKAPHIVLAEIQLRRNDPAAAQREQRKLPTLAETKWPDPYLEEVERLSVEVHTRIELARRLLAQERSAEGLKLLEETVEANPRSTAAWISLGQARLRLQQWQPAQRAFEQALAIDPGESIALADLGFALGRQGQLDRAVERYHQAIARNPQSPENYYQLSYCEFNRGQPAAAIDALRTAVRMRPTFALAWRELGQMLAGQGARAEARTCFERALELAPDDDVARKLLHGLRGSN
jgi:tetratricopeptide (TPR) repeat protein